MARSAKLRVESDGTLFRTCVYVRDAEGTLTKLDGVSRVEWVFDANDGHAIAHLIVHEVEIAADGEATLAFDDGSIAVARALDS